MYLNRKAIFSLTVFFALSTSAYSSIAAVNVAQEAANRAEVLVVELQKMGIDSVRDSYKKHRAQSVTDESGWVSIYMEEKGLSILYLISRTSNAVAVNVKDLKTGKVGEATNFFAPPKPEPINPSPTEAPISVPVASSKPAPLPAPSSSPTRRKPLREYIQTTDYNENGTAYVHDILGAELTHTPEGYVVRITNRQGPLARAGLRDGDVIFRIYKNHAPRIPSYELEPWLHRFAGKIARFSWMRGKSRMSQLVHFAHAD